MGYTKQDTELIEKYLTEVKSVMDIGSQNVYIEADNPKPPFASEWYKSKGIDDYSCIDLAGDNNALKIDLSYPIEVGLNKKFDLLVDGGCGEHIVQMEGYENVAFHDGHINSIYPTKVKNIDLGYYNGWFNKHNLLKIGGIMININPKTESWPSHCYTYLTTDFYIQLEKISGYKIIELFEHPAMGNTLDGWNIVCVMQKESDLFPDFETFNTLDKRKS